MRSALKSSPIPKILAYPSPAAQKRLDAIVGRSLSVKTKDIKAVGRILDEVRRHGDAALIGYVNRFDAPKMKVADLKVGKSEMAAAQKAVARPFRQALEKAANQIEDFHRRQVPASWFAADRPGTFLGQMVRAVDAAGIYVPGGTGGKTPLVSSVLMGAIPARIAGVQHLVMVTPPTADGAVNPHLLVAAKRAGVHEVYKIGSAWAIAALAFGTQTVPKTDVIVGPGNIWVTLAKKLVAGTVGIDMIAGPSEILIVADSSARAGFVAADMLSQAEHDPMASAMLLTDNKALATAVAGQLEAQLKALNRCHTAAQALARYGAIIVVPDIAAALDIANRIAPEHLELHLAEPFAWLEKVRNAGAVFLGHHSPEAVGDYIAGPNHVLPTAGTARFSSALSVETFLKKTSVIHYRPEALAADAAAIMTLARTEGLDAHAAWVGIRMKDNGQSRVKTPRKT
jgi:histidinol dehydrogenase